MLISLCVPFILGTSSLDVFSTIGCKEREQLGEQFERMRLERRRLEIMKGEQIACLKLILVVKLNQERC